MRRVHNLEDHAPPPFPFLEGHVAPAKSAYDLGSLLNRAGRQYLCVLSGVEAALRTCRRPDKLNTPSLRALLHCRILQHTPNAASRRIPAYAYVTSSTFLALAGTRVCGAKNSQEALSVLRTWLARGFACEILKVVTEEVAAEASDLPRVGLEEAYMNKL